MSSPPPFVGLKTLYIGSSAGTTPPLRTIHRLLRPAARAYLLGYAFTVGPRLLSLIRYHILLQLRKRRRGHSDHVSGRETQASFLQSARNTLTGGLELDRFATFCAALVGGCTLLEVYLPPLLAVHHLPCPKRVWAPLLTCPTPPQPILRKALARLLQRASDKSKLRSVQLKLVPNAACMNLSCNNSRVR